MGERRDPIVSLVVAAPGWRAVYREGGRVLTRDLTSWALVERELTKRQELVGIIHERGRRVFADQIGESGARFCGYAAPGSDAEDLQAPATLGPGDVGLASSWFG